VSCRYLLFDLDGTLTDSLSGIANGFRHAMRAMGLNNGNRPDDNDLSWTVGPPLSGSFLKLGVAPDEVEAAIVHYREYYDQIGWRENSVYPGIIDMLAALKRTGAHLFITTGKTAHFADKIADHFGLAPYFEGICGALPTSRRRKSEVIAFALDNYRIPPDQALVVGDRADDILGAIANGTDCIGVTYGFGNREELQCAGAKKIVTSVAELEVELKRRVVA